jgi:hypothetical protein
MSIIDSRVRAAEALWNARPAAQDAGDSASNALAIHGNATLGYCL